MIHYLYLSRIGYAEALALQQELVELRHQERIDNTLLLLEHPPVLTLGRNASRSNILASDEVLAGKGISIHEINRGGDVTYHGPGQLVGYPIFDLRSLTNAAGGRLGPVDYVRRMEEALIRLCGGYGVRTGRIAGRTGVWTTASDNPLGDSAQQDGQGGGQEKKIAAIGVHVSRGITSHGFAFNLTTDLRDFQWIVPCGIADREVTSLELEIPDPSLLPTLEQLADAAARHFGQVFDQQILALENGEAGLASLRGHAPDSGNQAPATSIGIPMQTPPEVDRLLRREASLPDKPVRA